MLSKHQNTLMHSISTVCFAAQQPIVVPHAVHRLRALVTHADGC